VDRLGGGKAVDYAAVEGAMAEGASRTELAAHGSVLKSLDMDVPAVVIGRVRSRAWDGVGGSATRWSVRYRWSDGCTGNRLRTDRLQATLALRRTDSTELEVARACSFPTGGDKAAEGGESYTAATGDLCSTALQVRR
jgi:hypothetical protein